MNTITIDSQIYDEALQYASKKKMSVSSLFEFAVRKLMDMKPAHQTQNVFESVKYEKALNFMDTIVADSYNIVVPVDEDGREARSEKYMK